MREKLAIAAYEAWAKINKFPTKPEDWGELYQEPWLAIADAILDAMMEPSEAMVNAAWHRPRSGTAKEEDALIIRDWQAMLRAAKEE